MNTETKEVAYVLAISLGMLGTKGSIEVGDRDGEAIVAEAKQVGSPPKSQLQIR